jgi:PTH1 family peptidyl-tRNA hydrolase
MLLVGLGNPGSQYEGTRHNVGFEVLSVFASYYSANFSYKEKFDCDISSAYLDKSKVFFIRPMTYMNLSGFSVAQVKEYYKIPIQNIIVIHDDMDIPLGKVKVKMGGGNAGHNGIKSIDNQIGNEYLRIRFGISRPHEMQSISSWVLEKFTSDERLIVDSTIKFLLDNISTIIKHDIIEINKIFTRNHGV